MWNDYLPRKRSIYGRWGSLKRWYNLISIPWKRWGDLDGKEKVELAIKLQNLCKKYNVPFIVNDDIELALEIDADGVHVGQDDLGVDEIRKLMPDKIIGLSIKNEGRISTIKSWICRLCWCWSCIWYPVKGWCWWCYRLWRS